MADLPPAVESELRLGAALSAAHIPLRRHDVVVIVRAIPEEHQESDEQLWEVLHVVDSREPRAKKIRELVDELLELGAEGVISVDLRRPTFVCPGSRFRAQRLWRYEAESTGPHSTWATHGIVSMAWLDVPGEDYPVVVGELSERQSWRRDRGQG